MKKYLCAIVAWSMALFGAELDWNDDYDKALKEAKAQNKDVYMLVTSSNCKWCKKFQKTTLQDEATIERLKQQYVLLHIDKNKNYMPKKFKKKKVPRHYFITNKGEVIYSFLGYWDVEDFASFLEDVDKKR